MGHVSGLFPDSAGYDSVLDWFCLKQIGIQQVHFFETYIYIYIYNIHSVSCSLGVLDADV